MFRKALVTTDLGESSEMFLKCKAGLKTLGVEELILGLCVPLQEVQGLKASMEDILKADLQHRREALESQGFPVSTAVLLGKPHAEVNSLAESENCDLVVIGSHISSLAGEVFLGGTAGEILHHCRKPLLVARIPVEKDSGESCPLACRERVLFPTDFSDNAEHAFAILGRLVKEGRKSVVLMHVQDEGKIDRHLKERLQEFNTIDMDRLDRMKDHLIAQGAQDVQIELPYGLPKKEILCRARQGDISLIVMGSQGRGYFNEILLGSVSYSVARHAPAPVLLIPALL